MNRRSYFSDFDECEKGVLMKKLAIENEFGYVDLKLTLPKRYVHVPGRQLQPMCRSLGIRFSDAVVAVKKDRSGMPLPIREGVIISAKQEAKLRVGIEKRTQRSAKARERRHAAEVILREQHLDRLRNLTISEAIVEGCAAMFRLNRAAKLFSAFAVRGEIYDLKNRWVQFLHCAGYCDRCEIHEVLHEAQRCYRCSRVRLLDDGYKYDECDRCDGSGVYREARTEQLVAFSFLVEGVRYTWHQPVRTIRFPYELTVAMPTKVSFESRVLSADRTQIPSDMELMKACISALERSGMINDSIQADSFVATS